MGITILHINIRNWNKNKYTLSVEINNHNPEIILVNETGKANEKQLKLLGYEVLNVDNISNHGAAIFIKENINYELIRTKDEGTLAIKILTNFGHIVIATAYSPPRNKSLPTITINKIFSLNLPAIMIADLNAHHPILHNTTTSRPYPDTKGKQLNQIIEKRNLNVLGPNFHTFQTRTGLGKPDVIITNQKFNLFHHSILQGNNIGSDHLPIVFKFQVKPIRLVRPSKPNLNTLDIKKYKEELSKIPITDIDHKPVKILDEISETLIKQITLATENNCDKTKNIIIKNYEPTAEIKQHLANYQTLVNKYFTTGFPKRPMINQYLDEIIELIKNHRDQIWNKLVQIAMECYGNPTKFWKKYKILMGGKSKTNKYLLTIDENEDSEDEDYGEITERIVTNNEEQAKIMSDTWSKIFKENKDPTFENKNTQLVEKWFEENKHKFKADELIDLSLLPNDHPIMRPISIQELNIAIKTTRNKAPGPSNISIIQIKNLPINCRKIILNIHNGILTSKYYPYVLTLIKMIFIGKPNKKPSNPLNYRPICLMESILKLFEKIITQRLQYYLEYHNIISEKQFGFRQNRNTNQATTLIQTAIEGHLKTKKSILICTRDVEKAFDTVWHKGLLYKLDQLFPECLNFTILIQQFLINRQITPNFYGQPGNPIQPTAGVPQGSSLGPILFLIYVNDHPSPIYDESIITQFADDLVHVVSSDGSGKNKTKQAKQKLEQELLQTLNWERKWKIKTNNHKCVVSTIGTLPSILNKFGGITVDGQPLPISNENKILGYKFNQKKQGTLHTKGLINKAKYNLSKLRRFQSAPQKIKLILIKTIIRPVLEYPPYPLTKISKNNKIKMQIVQNHSLRFVKGIKKSERKNIKDLHEELDIMPLNIRISKLNNKMINKCREIHYPKKGNEIIPHYKFSDYTIKEEPLRKKKQSVAQRIDKNILKINHLKNPILKEPKIEEWTPPTPIYTRENT